jgi:hypothetical protein
MKGKIGNMVIELLFLFYTFIFKGFLEYYHIILFRFKVY